MILFRDIYWEKFNLNALFEKTAISLSIHLPFSRLHRLSKNGGSKRTASRDRRGFSAGTAWAITRNHGSHYKTVPEGEFSCSTLCGDWGRRGKERLESGNAGRYDWRKVRSRQLLRWRFHHLEGVQNVPASPVHERDVTTYGDGEARCPRQWLPMR